jgi:hypothetical protein
MRRDERLLSSLGVSLLENDLLSVGDHHILSIQNQSNKQRTIKWLIAARIVKMQHDQGS